ncbi:MAG TPA: hypothetical protein VHF89_00815 [Solirubrobacteraceae bacterium]|nr:hypothetical protein [Solirubrobacteraceae bacterium]
MADRFRRGDEVAPPSGATSAATSTEEPRTAVDDGAAERERTPLRDRLRDRRPDRERHGAVDRTTMAAMRERQREEFGGIAWGSAFFGWLTATGLGAILAGILTAIGASLALTEGSQIDVGRETIGLASGIAFLVVLFVSYFAGGYVAGRMARFDGFRQGLGVFAWAIVIGALLAAAAAIGDSEWNVLERLDLPRLPIDEGDITTGGVIALVASLLTMAVAAVLGGKFGERFHRKVDRAAIDR